MDIEHVSRDWMDDYFKWVWGIRDKTHDRIKDMSDEELMVEYRSMWQKNETLQRQWKKWIQIKKSICPIEFLGNLFSKKYRKADALARKACKRQNDTIIEFEAVADHINSRRTLKQKYDGEVEYILPYQMNLRFA